MSKPKRNILFVHPFAQAISGPDESLLLQVKHLNKTDFRPWIWLPPDSPHAHKYRSAGAEIVEATTPALKRSFNPFFWLAFLLENFVAGKQLKSFVIKNKIELIHTNMEVVFFSGWVARKLNIPSIYHVRGTSFYRPAWLGRWMVGWIKRHADRIICISQAVKQLFEPVDSETCLTLYNPVDPKRFAPKAVPHPKSNRFLVGTAGRINPRKDFVTFIKAAKLVCDQRDDVDFVIIGGAANRLEEAYQQELKDLVRELQLESRLTFYGATETIEHAYAPLDLVYLGSISEGFGRVLAESAMMGKPLIGTRVGGIEEIIKDGENGWLVPPREPEATAAAIIKMLADPMAMQRMGARSMEQALKQFSALQYAKDIEGIYEHFRD